MQKKFVIIDNDKLFIDLIEEQISIVFKKNFKIKFLKNYFCNSPYELDKIDLLIVNFKFIKDNYNLLNALQNQNKSKIIFMFDSKIDRTQLKKHSDFHFIVKPFKLKQMIDIITDLFVGYEANQKNIAVTDNLIFRPETKTLLNKNNDVIINLTEKESKLLNFILENKTNVLKKDEILINVWGITERINTHTLETHIYSLKKKLDSFDYNHSFICSDNLGGYYFNELKM